jgi:hypothetical protein
MDVSCIPDLTFVVTEEPNIGQVEDVPLKFNGENILVTNSNKKEFIYLSLMRKLKHRTRNQMNAIRRGFNKLFPLKFLRIFTPTELSLLFCGVEIIDVNDWKNHTHVFVFYLNFFLICKSNY